MTELNKYEQLYLSYHICFITSAVLNLYPHFRVKSRMIWTSTWFKILLQNFCRPYELRKSGLKTRLWIWNHITSVLVNGSRMLIFSHSSRYYIYIKLSYCSFINMFI